MVPETLPHPHRLKVLYVITKGNLGGAQRYVRDLAKTLSGDFFETVVAFGEGKDLAELLTKDKVRTIEIPELTRDVSFRSDVVTFRKLIQIFRSEKPDVIHLNSSKIGVLGGMAARVYNLIFAPIKRRSAIIFTAHGWAFNEERSWLSKKMILIAHWWSVVLSHSTIAVSKKTKRDITHLPFVSSKIHIIYNGVDPFKPLKKSAARLALAQRATESQWIGTIAELHKNKGLDCAIEAFALYSRGNPDAGLFIIGDGEERKALEELAVKKEIRNRVHFLGFVPNAQIYLSAFDTFILTSRTEAFPYAILEAGSAKIPIIASSVGGIPEIIASFKTGLLVRPGNPKEVYGALAYMDRNKELVREWSDNLDRIIHSTFSVDTMIRNTTYIYKKHLKHPVTSTHHNSVSETQGHPEQKV